MDGWMDGVRKELRGMGMTLEQGRQNSLNRRECAAIVKIGVALGPSIHASKCILGTMKKLAPVWYMLGHVVFMISVWRKWLGILIT